MKAFALFVLFVITTGAVAQDTARAVEPDMETSFENYELLIIAVLGLLLLMGLRFWFRKTRKK